MPSGGAKSRQRCNGVTNSMFACICAGGSPYRRSRLILFLIPQWGKILPLETEVQPHVYQIRKPMLDPQESHFGPPRHQRRHRIFDRIPLHYQVQKVTTPCSTRSTSSITYTLYYLCNSLSLFQDMLIAIGPTQLQRFAEGCGKATHLFCSPGNKQGPHRFH